MRTAIPFIIVILLIGCGGQSKDIPDIYKGTNGAVISFIPDTPPKKVIEEGFFMVGLRLKNDGPVDIRRGVIHLGVESDFIEVMGWDQEGHDMDLQRIDQYRKTFDIDGKTLDHPMAREGLVTIRLVARKLPTQVETHSSLITSTVCYPYQTLLSQEVCIESDLFSNRQGVKVCEASPISLSSQGGPVAITKIEPTMHPSQDGSMITPHFKITVNNAGDGIVVPSDALLSCSSDPLQRKDINELTINAYLFDRALSCTPRVVRLESGTGEVRCELTGGVESTQDAYTSILRVEVDYGYTHTIHDTMIIQAKQ